jgi:hypothetical protein
VITAIYRQREDGDWDFIAAFSDVCEESKDWIADMRHYLEDETIRVVQHDTASDIPDVLET